MKCQLIAAALSLVSIAIDAADLTHSFRVELIHDSTQFMSDIF